MNTEKKISAVLKEAKALIADPKNWTQGYMGLDKNGSPIGSSKIEAAVCFCSLGALARIVNKPSSTAREFLEDFLDLYYQDSVAAFNDSHTHAEVMELWDKVIAAAESEGV